MITVAYHFPTPCRQARTFRLTPHQYQLLMPVGDVHYGAQGFPRDRVRAHIQWGIERGARFLGMGDYFERHSESQRRILDQLRDDERRSEDDEAQARVRDLASLLKGSEERWLGLLCGNHTHQFQDGTTADQRLAELLGAPYLGDMAHVHISIGTGTKQTAVVVVAHHGVGGGQLAGSGLNRLEKMPEIVPGGDIYLMGHNHAKVNAPLDVLVVTPEGVVYHRTRILARTGGFLRSYVSQKPLPNTTAVVFSAGTYIEKRALRPTALGGLVFSLGMKWEAQAGLWIPDLHYSV